MEPSQEGLLAPITWSALDRSHQPSTPGSSYARASLVFLTRLRQSRWEQPSALSAQRREEGFKTKKNQKRRRGWNRWTAEAGWLDLSYAFSLRGRITGWLSIGSMLDPGCSTGRSHCGAVGGVPLLVVSDWCGVELDERRELPTPPLFGVRTFRSPLPRITFSSLGLGYAYRHRGLPFSLSHLSTDQSARSDIRRGYVEGLPFCFTTERSACFPSSWKSLGESCVMLFYHGEHPPAERRYGLLPALREACSAGFFFSFCLPTARDTDTGPPILTGPVPRLSPSCVARTGPHPFDRILGTR